MYNNGEYYNVMYSLLYHMRAYTGYRVNCRVSRFMKCLSYAKLVVSHTVNGKEKWLNCEKSCLILVISVKILKI